MDEKPWMSLGGIEKHLPEMRRKHVSEVARSPRGFLRQYRQAGGRASGLSEKWRRKRNNFVKRHLAQARASREKLYDRKTKTYSRRGLALVAWAFDPKRMKRNGSLDTVSMLGVGALLVGAAFLYSRSRP